MDRGVVVGSMLTRTVGWKNWWVREILADDVTNNFPFKKVLINELLT